MWLLSAVNTWKQANNPVSELVKLVSVCKLRAASANNNKQGKKQYYTTVFVGYYVCIGTYYCEFCIQELYRVVVYENNSVCTTID